MKRSGRALLFFSSYLPCWIICAISQGLVFNNISGVGIGLTIASVVTLYYFKKTYQFMTQDNKTSIIIKKISNGSSEVMSYLITSVFLSTAGLQTLFNFIEGEYSLNIIISLIFGFTIFLIYINSNLIVVNPVLIIFGFRLYLIEYSVPNNLDINIDGILMTEGAFELDKIPSDPSDLLFQGIDESVFLLSG